MAAESAAKEKGASEETRRKLVVRNIPPLLKEEEFRDALQRFGFDVAARVSRGPNAQPAGQI